jgi:hypothetical protein
MPEQSNYRSELPWEIYRATSSPGVQDSQMPHNGSNYKNAIKRTKRTNKHQNNNKNTLVDRFHQMTILITEFPFKKANNKYKINTTTVLEIT